MERINKKLWPIRLFFLYFEQLKVKSFRNQNNYSIDFFSRYDVTEGRPVLKEYMERVKSELQPHYDDVHAVVYQMCKKFGGKIPGLEVQGAKL